MNNLIQLAKNNPRRMFAIVSSAIALVAHYYATLPVPLVLTFVGAVLGLGEVSERKGRKAGQAQ